MLPRSTRRSYSGAQFRALRIRASTKTSLVRPILAKEDTKRAVKAMDSTRVPMVINKGINKISEAIAITPSIMVIAELSESFMRTLMRSFRTQ